MNRRRSTGLVAALAAFTGCSDPGSGRATVSPRQDSPRLGSTVVHAAADGLAVELLLAGKDENNRAWSAQQVPLGDLGMARAVDAQGLDHAQSVVLGAGGGPRLLRSTLVARLAGRPAAPPDGNARYGNLDESLAAEVDRITTFAATTPPATTDIAVLPWPTRSAELDGPLDTEDNGSWVTPELETSAVHLADIANSIALRATVARRLLGEPTRTIPERARRDGVLDPIYGRTGKDGALGLLALQQALAAEDALFNGAFTNGGPLGALTTPREYDPRTGPRWLPAAFVLEPATASSSSAHSFAPRDSASDLAATAALLDAALQLSALALAESGNGIRELFRGRPFEPPPAEPVLPPVSWSGEIRALLSFRCGQCHLQQSFGGFSIQSYESMRRGGNKTRALNLQFVVPGNAEASLLPEIITDPPPPFVQMPFVGEILPPEVALIVRWIDEGALQEPTAPPSPPRPGDDLAQVTAKNLVALHLHATGGLHHRRESDAPSGLATATATGRTLHGLSAFVELFPETTLGGRSAMRVLGTTADFAARRQLDENGRAAATIDLATGVPQGPADLIGQAELTTGLLAAQQQLRTPFLQARARAAADRLLADFRRPSGRFGRARSRAADELSARDLAALLRALRYSAAAGVPGAAAARDALVQQIRPVLAHAEWDRLGEVIGDGIADSDGNGIPEPALAGGPFGRLPLLGDRIVFDPAAPPLLRAPTWSRDVRPLLERKCGECHMHGNALGNYRLDTLALLRTPGESGGLWPMLVPGAANESLLFDKIRSRSPRTGAQMPSQRPPLSEAGVELVRRWIDEGATAR